MNPTTSTSDYIWLSFCCSAPAKEGSELQIIDKETAESICSKCGNIELFFEKLKENH